MASKNGSSPDPDPDELVRQIEQTRDDLAETVDAIAERVSPKRVAARTKDRVRAALKDGAASVSAGADVVKGKLTGSSEPPAPPARPLDGGPTTVLPPAAGVPVPPLDLSQGPGPSSPTGGSVALGHEAGTTSGAPAVRPEYLAGALAALVALLLWRRRRAARRKTGLAALLER